MNSRRMWQSVLGVLVVASLATSACRGGVSGGIFRTLPTGTPATITPEARPTPAPSPTPTLSPTPTSAPAAPRAGALPSLSEVVDRARPAVVAVLVQSTALDFFLQPVPQQGAGSGSILSSDGLIFTNNHVVEGARKITVVLPPPDSRTFEARLVGRDPVTDLAIIKIDATDLPTLKLGRSTDVRVGEWVVAIGNALGLEGGPTVTAGVVSAVGRSIESGQGRELHDLIQTDAAINPGNSGGPLINLQGEAIGINTAILANAQGLGFAISVDSARPILTQLIDRGRVLRAWLGVSIATVTAALAVENGLATNQGVLVAGVVRGGPAERGGLRPRDVIVTLEGQELRTARALTEFLLRSSPGDTVRLDVFRGPVRTTLNVTLGEAPAPSGP
ncbi:MAG: PDZ domain-containing protein [Dehalococcoidia bacterium]|nr:PDZ domain-containing protein [Dehalococcoidia bacterium]